MTDCPVTEDITSGVVTWCLQSHRINVRHCLGDRERHVQIRPIKEQIEAIWKLQMWKGIIAKGISMAEA